MGNSYIVMVLRSLSLALQGVDWSRGQGLTRLQWPDCHFATGPFLGYIHMCQIRLGSLVASWCHWFMMAPQWFVGPRSFGIVLWSEFQRLGTFSVVWRISRFISTKSEWWVWVWVWKFSSNNPKSFNFFPFGSKISSSGGFKNIQMVNDVSTTYLQQVRCMFGSG